MIKEFLNANANAGPEDVKNHLQINRKASVPISAINMNDSAIMGAQSANSRLESLI